MGFDRPLAYSHYLQGGGWVIEMCLQWKGRLVVPSLRCLGIKVSSVRNPLRWPRRGALWGRGWICKYFLFTLLWNTENKGKPDFLYFPVFDFSVPFLLARPWRRQFTTCPTFCFRISPVGIRSHLQWCWLAATKNSKAFGLLGIILGRTPLHKENSLHKPQIPKRNLSFWCCLPFYWTPSTRSPSLPLI